jgi:hypothetical protein
MSCSEIDVRDYFFGEAPDAAAHVAGCADCTAELDRLRTMRTTLLTLHEEEPPQRIGFVSDKIFEPSPWRRFFANFWLSGAQLGFASAAMLSAALLIFSAGLQRKIVELDVNTIVARAVAVSDRKHQAEELELEQRVAEYTTNLDKRMAMNNKMMSVAYSGEVRQ